MKGTSGTLSWGSKYGTARRADAMPRSLDGVGTIELAKEQRLSKDELSRCFQVVLIDKQLILMAANLNDKQLWVAGINAVIRGLFE